MQNIHKKVDLWETKLNIMKQERFVLMICPGSHIPNGLGGRLTVVVKQADNETNPYNLRNLLNWILINPYYQILAIILNDDCIAQNIGMQDVGK